MRKIFRIASIALAVNGAVFAQTTWQGLRFGMSGAEVRKVYGGVLRVEVSKAQETVLVDDSRELLGAALSVRAKVDLFLGKADKLEAINIIVKNPFADEKDATGASGSTLAALAELTDRLTDKYGQPTTEKGQCNLTAEMLATHKTLSCDKMWRSDGQNVKMFWSVFDGRLRDFGLSYKPFPADF
jgi:hypothetical protein